MAEKEKEKVNTSEDLKEGKKVTAAEMDKEVKTAAKTLESQKKVKVTIPKYLKSRLGATVPVAVNGAVIHVPVGKEVAIPQAMAKVLNRSLNNLKL